MDDSCVYGVKSDVQDAVWAQSRHLFWTSSHLPSVDSVATELVDTEADSRDQERLVTSLWTWV